MNQIFVRERPVSAVRRRASLALRYCDACINHLYFLQGCLQTLLSHREDLIIENGLQGCSDGEDERSYNGTGMRGRLNAPSLLKAESIVASSFPLPSLRCCFPPSRLADPISVDARCSTPLPSVFLLAHPSRSLSQGWDHGATAFVAPQVGGTDKRGSLSRSCRQSVRDPPPLLHSQGLREAC